VITSAANPRLKLVRRLESRQQRERLGLFVCEGEDLVEAGLAAGAEPVDVLVAGETVEPQLLAALSMLAHPPRVIAVFRRADLPRLDPAAAPPAGLALWRVGDPGNVGTLVRAADGLGPAFVALSAGCADPTGPKALRASMGAIFQVPVGRFDEAPGRRIALVPDGGDPLQEVELEGPVTFVLGSEREGLPEDVVAECEEAASIPLEPGSESLNVALTGGIALYELRRRRSVDRHASVAQPARRGQTP
jgi:RNA methyltransferase, TrmH family